MNCLGRNHSESFVVLVFQLPSRICDLSESNILWLWSADFEPCVTVFLFVFLFLIPENVTIINVRLNVKLLSNLIISPVRRCLVRQLAQMESVVATDITKGF
jgi:hypothetical protein